MIKDLHFDQQKTVQRLEALDAYFQAEVMNGKRFICQNYRQCRNSHPGAFYQGQLHHVGSYYDAFAEGHPYRIMVVGQEYGHKPPKVSLGMRHEMILQETGLQKNFGKRNPHMRGVTSALRLLYGIPPGSDHETEFLQTGNEELHIFDAFSLANYLLCSAVDESQSRRGKATSKMLTDCGPHFRKAVEILEPTVLVVQSKGYWGYIAKVFEQVRQITNELYQARLGEAEILVAVFAHPSTPDSSHNWGISATTPYLQTTVTPTIKKIHRMIFGLETIPNKPDKSRIYEIAADKPKKTVKIHVEEKMSESVIAYETFYGEMQARFRTLLPAKVLAHNPDYKVQSNRMAIYLSGISGSHYEICLRKNYHEIALHFQSTPERSLARRQAFDPLLNQLSDTLGRNVLSGKLENCGWMRVWIECPITPITEKVLAEYTELFAHFIRATFPTLEKVYQQKKTG